MKRLSSKVRPENLSIVESRSIVLSKGETALVDPTTCRIPIPIRHRGSTEVGIQFIYRTTTSDLTEREGSGRGCERRAEIARYVWTQHPHYAGEKGNAGFATFTRCINDLGTRFSKVQHPSLPDASGPVGSWGMGRIRVGNLK